MRMRTLGIAVAVAAGGLFQVSDAVVRPKIADEPFVSANRGPRTYRTTGFEKTKLAVAGLPQWTAIYDRDTDVPLRLWGPGQLVAGSVADPAIAEAAARQFLATHLALLAPGAAITDFELVSNALSRNRDVRSVGFIQRAHGVKVAGGTLGVAFKRDRLVMVNSTALPHVAVSIPSARLAPTLAAARAVSWLDGDGFEVAPKHATSLVAAERVIIPVVRPRLAGAPIDVTYQVAEEVEVASKTGLGSWDVWVDAGSGAPIARRSKLFYATGKVLFDIPVRHPNGVRTTQPSIFTNHVVNGTATTSTVDGTLTWAGTAASTVATRVVGPFVRIVNQGGQPATDTLTLPAEGLVTWSRATNELADAQLTSFFHASFVKQFAKTRLNPQLEWLNQQIRVTVNIAQNCNANSDGDNINFFHATQQCQNTGRMADVVYHEFGHSLHIQSMIPGVGQFDGALSEGVSDVLASLLTNDHGMGRGFFYTDAPLRDIDPVGSEKVWPTDATGEPHDDGEIIGGTLWDLRTALEAKLGQAAGYEKSLDLYYAIIQRSSDIPSTYAEALLADDDDGDLTNGTPNQCEINTVFGTHGLADPSVTVGISPPVREDFNITIAASGGSGTCPGPTITSATVDWKLRGDASTTPVALSAAGTTYAGAIPTQPDGSVVQYKVTVALSDGTTVSFPKNPADPLYEFYVGPVTVIKCFGFEAGDEGWTHGSSSVDEWQAGSPLGLGGDPKVAHTGTGVFGIDLTQDGTYEPETQTFAESPEIDLAGNTAVRLQLHRWLGVEDGFYDHARLLVNGTEVWSNFASVNDPQAAGINHLDREWRFADFDLAAHAASGKVKLRFELESDQGLQLAGWTLDDVCVVVTGAAPLTCGNGTVDADETCDDGNRTDGDGCSGSCQDETGPGGSEGGGCCSVGSGPESALALSLLTLGLVLRRRRRR